MLITLFLIFGFKDEAIVFITNKKSVSETPTDISLNFIYCKN